MVIGVIALASTLVSAQGGIPFIRRVLEKVEAAHLKTPFYRVIELTTTPDGEVVACEAGEGKGDPDSMEKACQMAIGTHYGTVAKIDGKRAYGRTRTVIMAFYGPSKILPVSRPPELLLNANVLPDTPERPSDFAMDMLVSPAGRVERCEPLVDTYRTEAAVACSQVANTTYAVVKDRKGIPVPYVNTIRVGFYTE